MLTKKVKIHEYLSDQCGTVGWYKKGNTVRGHGGTFGRYALAVIGEYFFGFVGGRGGGDGGGGRLQRHRPKTNCRSNFH
jgi:hypothetical protein